jgi:hypothetical protein
VMECFHSSLADLQARARADPEVFALDAFEKLLEETNGGGGSSSSSSRRGLPPRLGPQWVQLMSEIPVAAGASGKKTLRGLFRRAAPWRRVHARLSSADSPVLEFFVGDAADAEALPRRLSLALLRGCYAREDADLLELETSEESFVLGFKESKDQLQPWCAMLNEWISHLHTTSAAADVSRKAGRTATGLKG